MNWPDECRRKKNSDHIQDKDGFIYCAYIIDRTPCIERSNKKEERGYNPYFV